MKKEVKRPGQFHRTEMTLTLYTGEDHRRELRELRRKVEALPESVFDGTGESRAEMLASIDEMTARVEQKFGDYTPERIADQERQRKETFRRLGRELVDAEDICKPLFEGRQVKEIRSWAKTVYRCSDCGLVIALVIPVGMREVLLVRSKAGQMKVQFWLETDFWGSDAYCKRRHFSLYTSELRDEGRRVVSVSHADKA